MDILDIIIAKGQSFTAQTAQLIRRAQQAITGAEQAVAAIDEIEATATSAAETATAAAETLSGMQEDIVAAATDIVDSRILETTVTGVDVTSNNNSNYYSKILQVEQEGVETTHLIDKNYTSTGNNEDGSMTQKAITDAIAGAHVNGDFSNATPGSFAVVDSSGDLTASTIKEEDVVALQIAAGTYRNNNIIGLEIDYANNTCNRLQGAIGKNPGSDFNAYEMYRDRRRVRIMDGRRGIAEITSSAMLNTMQMVYQPAFYYMRVPITTLNTPSGIVIEKEQLFLSDTPLAGFKLHPLFYGDDGQPQNFALLPAYEGCAVINDTPIVDDAQNINLQEALLGSYAGVKPISGASQTLDLRIAKNMAERNGTGWHLTDLRFESAQQMLMMVEFGTTNIQSAFYKGISQLTNSGSLNVACTTGSTNTFNFVSNSGRATSSQQNINGTINTFTQDGMCAITYRGVENPYGNIWRFVDDAEIGDGFLWVHNTRVNIKLPSETGWINRFGYDSAFDWIYLPIQVGNGASSLLPVGDYMWAPPSSGVTSFYKAGGKWNAGENIGLFYAAFDTPESNASSSSQSARIMYIPTTGSLIDGFGQV